MRVVTLWWPDPDQDMGVIEAVLAEIARFVPRVEVCEVGCVAFDARGPSRYFGGEATLAGRIVESVAPVLAVRPHVGIADGRFTSSVAARTAKGEPRLISPGTSRSFLAPLPIEWLCIAGFVEAGLVDLFRRLGLKRLGDLAALAPGDVASRFGRSGSVAHKLATGNDDDLPIIGVNQRDSALVERRLDTLLEQIEPVIFVVKHLADQLVAQLTAEGRTCTRLAVTAETEHCEISEQSWYRAGGLSAAAMIDRGRRQLSAWITSGIPTAGVTLVRLIAEETRADDGEPIRLWGGPTDIDRRAARATIHIAGLIGEEAVQVPIWAGGQLHDQRWRWIAAANVELTDLEAARHRVRPGSQEGPWPGAIPPPAPLRVPAMPEPAELCDRHGQAVVVDARGELVSDPSTLAIGGGGAETVISWAGPWPVHTRWWDPARRRRAARLQVITARGEAHVLLIEQNRWSVTGTYT